MEINDINTVIELITPAKAIEYLESNVGNRKVREWWVKQLAETIKNNGGLEVTPDAIAFDKAGRLINGQHRLLAIAMSGIPTRQMVSTGLSQNSFAYTDRGAKRSLYDTSKVEKNQVQVLTLLFTYSTTASNRTDPMYIRHFSENGFNELYHSVITSGTNKVFFSSAPAKLGAILAVNEGESADLVKHRYSIMVNSHIGDMTKCQQSALKQTISGSINASSDKLKNIARMFKLYSGCAGGDVLRLLEDDVESARKAMKNLFSKYECGRK